jgi:hypothetical protein
MSTLTSTQRSSALGLGASKDVNPNSRTKGTTKSGSTNASKSLMPEWLSSKLQESKTNKTPLYKVARFLDTAQAESVTAGHDGYILSNYIGNPDRWRETFGSVPMPDSIASRASQLGSNVKGIDDKDAKKYAKLFKALASVVTTEFDDNQRRWMAHQLEDLVSGGYGTGSGVRTDQSGATTPPHTKKSRRKRERETAPTIPLTATSPTSVTATTEPHTKKSRRRNREAASTTPDTAPTGATDTAKSKLKAKNQKELDFMKSEMAATSKATLSRGDTDSQLITDATQISNNAAKKALRRRRKSSTGETETAKMPKMDARAIRKAAQREKLTGMSGTSSIPNRDTIETRTQQRKRARQTELNEAKEKIRCALADAWKQGNMTVGEDGTSRVEVKGYDEDTGLQSAGVLVEGSGRVTMTVTTHERPDNKMSAREFLEGLFNQQEPVPATDSGYETLMSQFETTNGAPELSRNALTSSPGTGPGTTSGASQWAEPPLRTRKQGSGTSGQTLGNTRPRPKGVGWSDAATG